MKVEYSICFVFSYIVLALCVRLSQNTLQQLFPEEAGRTRNKPRVLPTLPSEDMSSASVGPLLTALSLDSC